MNTKQKWLIVALVAVLCVGSVCVVLIVRKAKTASQSQTTSTPSNQNGTVGSLQPSNTVPISLNDTSKEEASSDPNALSVTSEPTNDFGGSTTQTNTPANSPSSAPSFSQYEQYKDKTEVYFSDATPGTGTLAENGKRAEILYKGYLTNGTLFDQSRQNSDGKFITLGFSIGAGEVVRGMEYGVVGMKVGGQRRIIIPPSLGYGETGVQGVIPSNAVLIFDVHLASVK